MFPESKQKITYKRRSTPWPVSPFLKKKLYYLLFIDITSDHCGKIKTNMWQKLCDLGQCAPQIRWGKNQNLKHSLYNRNLVISSDISYNPWKQNYFKFLFIYVFLVKYENTWVVNQWWSGVLTRPKKWWPRSLYRRNEKNPIFLNANQQFKLLKKNPKSKLSITFKRWKHDSDTCILDRPFNQLFVTLQHASVIVWACLHKLG